MKDDRTKKSNIVEPSQEDPAVLTRGERTRRRLAAKKKRRRAIRRSTPFFTALCILTVVAWLLPLRPTISEDEKRPLKEFPDFSVSELFSGHYFSEIEDWFADTFTFRETWINSTQRFKDMYGIKTVMIHGALPTNDAVPVIPKVENTPAATAAPTPEATMAPAPEAAPTPAPEATPIPEQTPAPVVTPEITPEPAQQPEPMAVQPEEIPEVTPEITEEEAAVVADEFVGDTSVLQLGDSTFCYPGFNQYGADLYAQTITRMANRIEGKANLYDIIVPENASFMLTRQQREKYGFTIEEDAFAYIKSQMGENVHCVDALSNLQAHNKEYVAFRTDHHWTARGAYYAYEAWCKEAGKTPVPLSEYEELEYPGFLGSYFYAAAKSKLLEEHPDTVYAYKPKGDVHMYLDFTNLDYLGEEYDLICDRTKSTPGSKYMAFLWADEAKVTFVNNDITDGSAIAIFKTSFGNPFVYYFTQHYQYVYVLDVRNYNLRKVDTFCEKFNCSDVIVIHGSAMCYDAGSMGIFGKYA